MKVFPEIDPDVLCQLSELDPPTPSNVLALFPGASSADIARFFDLLSGTAHHSPTLERRSISKQPASVAGSLVDGIKSNLDNNSNDRVCVVKNCLPSDETPVNILECKCEFYQQEL